MDGETEDEKALPVIDGDVMMSLPITSGSGMGVWGTALRALGQNNVRGATLAVPHRTQFNSQA